MAVGWVAKWDASSVAVRVEKLAGMRVDVMVELSVSVTAGVTVGSKVLWMADKKAGLWVVSMAVLTASSSVVY